MEQDNQPINNNLENKKAQNIAQMTEENGTFKDIEHGMLEYVASETFQSIGTNKYKLKFMTGHQPRKRSEIMLQNVYD